MKKILNSELNLLFENTAGHAICMLTLDGCIKNWNKSAETLTGYKREEVLGKEYSFLFSKDSIKAKIPSKKLKCALKKKISISEDVLIHKNGKPFWASCVLSVANMKNGKPKYFVLVIQDINKKKEAERQKDEYIGIASHELKTPVSALSLYSELIAERLNLGKDEMTFKMFQDMRGQINRLMNLIEDLLLVNEVDRNKLTLNKRVFDINKLIFETIKNFQRTTTTHRIIIKGKIKDKVIGDDRKISQVLVNLIANAIKYSPGAKKIVVEITREKNKAVISVQDFGEGISPKDQKEVFSPYFRSYSLQKGNIPGLGLGLYISREIIKKHKEKIWLKSEKGKGTTFYFSLPLSNI